jgi:hypothetical protein
MSNKTVKVLPLLEWANKNLRRTDEFATVDFKAGICSMIEMVLHSSGNYRGFGFHRNSDSDCGTLGYYSRAYYYSDKMSQTAWIPITTNLILGTNMSYFDSPKHRRLILDKLRVQLAEAKDSSLLDDLDFSDWGEAFDNLNTQFWKGTLPKIPVTIESTKKRRLGWYGHRGYIKLSSNKGMTGKEMFGVLLHEMCHHYVQVTYGHGYSAAAGGKRVIGHGVEWKREMRRVGYTGKVTMYNGKERFC